MDEQSIEKRNDEFSESKLESTALEDQDWLAIKEESLFSNEAFFIRKFNDLVEEDKQDKIPLSEEKESEGVIHYFNYFLSHMLIQISGTGGPT